MKNSTKTFLFYFLIFAAVIFCAVITALTEVKIDSPQERDRRPEVKHLGSLEVTDDIEKGVRCYETPGGKLSCVKVTP